MSANLTKQQWAELHNAAAEAMRRAYCPYSKYPVGAAALVDDGRIVTGCNVENAAYGVALCAECGLVSDLINGGGGKLVAFVCLNALEQPAAPCGRCRQLLFEHADPNMILAMPGGRKTIQQVLPEGFGPTDLEAAEEGRDSGVH